MPSCPRSMIVSKGEIGIYHCWNRCVQRAWLCGKDPATGRDYEYRRVIIERVERLLARLFAIDVCFQSEMANHIHLVLRTRPDIAATYSDEEMLRRWWIVARLKRNGREDTGEPTQEDLEEERLNWPDMDDLRSRLSDISWFMGALAEHLSRRFNRESGTSGTFWEHRYECRRLEDVGSVLVCGMYVDINPIRSGEARAPEEARYTSAYHRIQALLRSPGESVGEPAPDAWLCPLSLSDDDDQLGAVPSQGPWRASDKGLLPITLAQYLELLDWTGRQIRDPGQGSIPESMPPILERLGIRSENWLVAVTEFGRRFGHVAGARERMTAAARAVGRQWFRGAGSSDEFFL